MAKYKCRVTATIIEEIEVDASDIEKARTGAMQDVRALYGDSVKFDTIEVIGRYEFVAVTDG